MNIRLLILLMIPSFLYSQLECKKVDARRFEQDIVVDGKLTDEVWQNPDMPVATDFVMLEPGNGHPIPERFKTDVKIYHNDDAFYVGVMMYDNHPDSIHAQLTQRDDYFQHHDWFLLAINPYDDGLSDFNFVVTSAGVQADSRTTADGDDLNWNTVWQSAVEITDSGWCVELKIPYMALRFPETQLHTWGINMIRNIRRNRTQWSWNYIDRTLGYRYEYQCGKLVGIESIDPPLRLSLQPYFSAYADNYDGTNTYEFNGGLDLKYGINESFTLDMTLIPDFGQVALDPQFVNFSPFENRFDENRQFFTEGTELFSIGDIFYSRRIGGTPKNISNVNLNDSSAVDVRTDYTRMLNATKVSGRTDGNLGIGFLNAITAESYTTFTDADGNEQRQLTEPLTNYNMIVLDQRFNRNSSVSFVNTNVLRSGSFYDANVAGLLTTINFLEGNYQFDGSIKRSDKTYTSGNVSGYEMKARIGDVDGNWVWGLLEDVRTDTYDPNDMGFQQRNNMWKHYGELEYRILQPHGKLNRSSYKIYAIHQSLYEPRRFERFYIGLSTFWLEKNFNGFGTEFVLTPVSSYDYFEPRTPGFFFKTDQKFSASGFVSTDYRKTLALDANAYYEHWFNFDRHSMGITLEPRLRLGDHFFSIFTTTLNSTTNDYGYANSNGGFVNFGRRDRYEITNAINGRYVFDNTKTLSLVARHFWTGLYYLEMYELQQDGTLNSVDIPMQADLNFNTITLDLKFSWWYAPGSELVLLYRYVVGSNTNTYEPGYINNFETAVNSPTDNSISLRLTYFLDYHNVKKIF